MSNLFPSVQKTIIYIKNKYVNSESNCFYIYGDKESGKTYLIDELVQYFQYPSVVIDGNNQINNDYLDLIIALNNVSNKKTKGIKKLLDEAAKGATTTGIPFVNTAVNIIMNYREIKRRNKYYNISDIENEIINRMEYLAKKKSLLIVLDNLENIDASSLKLINFLYTNKNDVSFEFMKDSIILITSNLNSDANNNMKFLGAINTKMGNCTIEKNSSAEFELYLKEQYTSIWDSELFINELYSIVGGNLGSATKILSLIIGSKENLLYGKSKSIDELMFNILNKRLKTIENKFFEISDVLKYASIIGNEFEKALIYYLFNIDDGVIDKKLALSINEKFLNKFEDVYKFTSHYVRNFFWNLTAQNRKEFHYSIAILLKNIRPSEYNLRYFHLIESQHKDEANSVLIVMCIRHLIKYGELGNILIEQLNNLPLVYQKYFNSIYNAISLYRNNGQLSDIEECLSLQDFNIDSELLIEKDYIYALTIYHLGREKNFSELKIILEEYFYNDIINHDQRIRFGILLMLLYINRLGDEINAKIIHRKLILEISEKGKNDKILELSLNKIKRISPALYSLEVALIQTKESMSYFKNNIEYDIDEYVYSLTNHVGILIILSKYDEAYAISLEGLLLINRHNSDKNYHKFFNNYIISGLYSNNININDCEKLFRMLLETDENLNSKSLLINNYAVILVRNNKVKESNVILASLVNKFSEGQKNDYYKYLFTINYVCVCVINKDFEKALLILDKLNFLVPKICIKEEDEILESYNVLYDIINLKPHIKDYEQFESIYSNKIDNGRNKYWKEPFKLTDLQYWSEF